MASPVRSGTCAARSEVVAQPAGTISGAMLIDPGPIPSDAYESAWFFVPEAIADVGYWVFFKLGSRTVGRRPPPASTSGTSTCNRRRRAAWRSRSSHARRASPPLPLLGSPAVPIGRWFLVEAHLRASPYADGVLELWLDDTQLFDLRGPTTPSAAVGWSIGGGCEELTSPAAVLDIDDAAVATRRLGSRFPIFTR